MIRFLFIFISSYIFFPAAATAQTPGCTDPQATNYNPNATVNDGSCLYPTTSINPQIIVNPLASQLSENSGLIFFHNQLWTHNDSGGEAALFIIDTTNGNIIHKVVVKNAVNTDWEDIAQDDINIYIGDFGNNNGNRTDLKILKISKDSLQNLPDSVNAENILFSYADQSDFTSQPQNTEYDCEAMMVKGDSIFLFSKDWVNNHCKLYTLPKSSGTHQAVAIDSFDTGGMITGADIDSAGNIVLIGYNYSQFSLTPFLFILREYPGSLLFHGHKRKIGLSLILTQAEGIASYGNNNWFFSNERIQQVVTINAKLFKFNISQWLSNPTTHKGTQKKSLNIKIFPNPSKDLINLEFSEISKGTALINIYSPEGIRLWENQYEITPDKNDIALDISILNSGIYIINISLNGSTSRQHIVKIQAE